MNGDEEAQFPWFVDEVKAIRQAVDRELPYLGFRFGGQILAKALVAPAQSTVGRISHRAPSWPASPPPRAA